MHANQEWVSMFRRLPGNLHEALSLGTVSGAEVLVQKILKVESEFIILRGRLSGTQDNRVMLMPYAQLTFVTIMRHLKDEEAEAIFGKGAAPARADLPTPAASDEGTAKSAPPEEKPTAEPAKKPVAPSKSVLVAKLRERLKDK